jgi:hypothetical protein
MAQPSEHGVSLAIRSPGVCGRYATASRSSPGKVGSGSLFACAQIGVPALRVAGRTTLENQQDDCQESDDHEVAFHLPCGTAFPLSGNGCRDALLRQLRPTAGTRQDMGSTVHKSGLPSPSGKRTLPHQGAYSIGALRRFVSANGGEPASRTVSNRSTHESGLACLPCHR